MVTLTLVLHGASWIFGFMHRLARFGLFPSGLTGFTLPPRWKVHFLLDVLPLVAPEIHVLLTSPLVRVFDHRSRLGLSVDSTFRRLECLTSVADDRSEERRVGKERGCR